MKRCGLPTRPRHCHEEESAPRRSEWATLRPVRAWLRLVAAPKDPSGQRRSKGKRRPQAWDFSWIFSLTIRTLAFDWLGSNQRSKPPSPSRITTVAAHVELHGYG